MKKQVRSLVTWVLLSYFVVVSLLPFHGIVYAQITLPWSNGFEEGSFSAWDGTREDGTTATVTSSISNSGTYSANFTGIGTSGNRGYPYKDLETTYSDINVRAYFQVDYKPPIQEMDMGVIVFNSTSPSVTPDAVIAKIAYQTSTSKWGVVRYGGVGYYESGTSTLSINTMYCVELRSFIDNTNGFFSLWVDGNLKLNQTSIDNNDRGDVGYVGAGVEYVGIAYPSNQEMYIDDFVVDDDEYIGLEETSELPFSATSIALPYAYQAIGIMSLALVIGMGAGLILVFQDQNISALLPLLLTGIAILIVLFIALPLLNAFSGL